MPEILPICGDPSSFVNSDRLRAFIGAVSYLREITPHDRKFRLILPEVIHQFILTGGEDEHVNLEMVSLIGSWWPDSKLEDVREAISDSQYREHLAHLETFEPMSSREFLEGTEELGTNSLKLSELVQKMGSTLGRTVFQILGVANRVGAMIVTFGTRLATLLNHAAVFTMTLPSRFKHSIKSHAGLQKYGMLLVYWVIAPGGAALLTSRFLSYLGQEALVISTLVSFFMMAAITKALEKELEKGLAIILDGGAVR